MARIRQFWINIKTSFWFIPTVINLGLIFIALSVLRLDKFLAERKHYFPFEIRSFELESLRSFLSTIAGSMITIAGVVFSITILVLAQTASQYTSRVLRNFMRNKINQVTLGIFVGIFVFCLFLITNLHPTDNALTATTGFILAVTGVGFLIYYIHQISISIQATEILRNIQEETEEGIKKLYPNPYEEKETQSVTFDLICVVLSNQSGYLQAVDIEILHGLASEYTTKIEVLKKVGDFIATGEEICKIEKDAISDENFASRIYRSFIIGKYRTASQDVAYGIQQVVDLALRGLSPGINDLSTAQVAIDHLKSIYIQLANRDLGSPIHYQNDQPTIIVPIQSFESLLQLGFKSICANAKDQPTIQEKINQSIEIIKKVTKSKKRKTLFDQYTCCPVAPHENSQQMG